VEEVVVDIDKELSFISADIWKNKDKIQNKVVVLVSLLILSV
jgi:hypothetical protein